MALSAPAIAVVDLAPPTLTGTAGDNGWFTSDVVVKWTYSGETSTSGCDTQNLTADTAATTITCTASPAPASRSPARSRCTSTRPRRPPSP